MGGKIPRQRASREALRQATGKPVPAGGWRLHGWRLAAVWGIALIAYSNSFQSGLVFDNDSIIARDPRIRQVSAENVSAILTGGYRYANPHDGLYRPLTTLTYLANYTVLRNESQPAGYHWVNLAVHEVNVGLVYGLGVLIFGGAAPAVGLAAIWGLHPVLTESVTNIGRRAKPMLRSTLLTGLMCYIRGASAAGRRRFAWFAGVAAAQAIGLFAKESAAVLPAIMLLYDLACGGGAPRAEGQGIRGAWRRRAPAYAALLLPIAAYLYMRAQVHPQMLVGFAENPLIRAEFWTARLTAVKVLGKLLWLFVWPAHLSADYSYNAVPLFGWGLSWEDAKTLIALAALFGAGLLMLLLATRWRRGGAAMLFFLAFFFIAAAPTSNLSIKIGSIMAERFLYLPSVGLAGFAVAGILALGRRRGNRRSDARAALIALTVACLALAARTYARNFDWRDEVSLWTSAAEVCPESGKAHYNLAQALERSPGRLSDAIVEYEAALRIDPDDVEAHTNLGNALASTGRAAEAIAQYHAALRINPNRAEAHTDLGNVLAGLPGRLPEAVNEYQAALRIRPNDAEFHYNLANALLRMPGRLADAIAEYRAALRIDPNHADAHANLGQALTALPGGLPEAIAEFRAAVRINPELAAAHTNLANALSTQPGGLPEAIAEYQAAVRIQPRDAEAHYNLATALERIPSRSADAIAEYQEAVRIAPGFMEAHVNLGNALAQAGRVAEAVSEYDAALRIRPDPEVRQMADRLRARR